MQDYPVVDLTAIDFPTDRLTIKHLRSLFPNRFDLDNSGKITFLIYDENFQVMLEYERRMTIHAFTAAIGQSICSNPLVGIDEVKETLSECYFRYGLASGLHSAHELIGTIETAAAKQANALTGGQSPSIAIVVPIVL